MKLLLRFSLLLLVILSSCRNDLETADWDVDLLAPILTSDLDFGDIAGDSNLTIAGDSSLIFVYRTPLASYGLSDIMDPFSYTHYEYLSLDSLELEDIAIPASISLGQIANNAGFVGALIIAQNGNTMVVPYLGGVLGTSAPIDASDYFESISLVDGVLEMKIQNGLPIDVEDFGFGIINNLSGQVLIQDTLDYIAAGATVTSTTSLAGKTIDSDLLVEIYGLSSPGSNGQNVLIDTSNALSITLTIRDLKPFSATTIWPEQNIINDTSEVFLEGSEGLELTYGRMRSGEIQMTISSTINDSVEFEYIIPESDLNGIPFSFTEAITVAPNGSVSTVVNTYDFTGIEMDLTGKNHDLFNTFYHIILGRIDSTGLIIELSLEDSLTVELALSELIIDYALGNLGEDTVAVGPEQTELIGLSKLVSGFLTLDQTTATLELVNPVGAGAQFQLDQITGTNSRTNQSVMLDLSVAGNSIQVAPAQESNGVISPSLGDLELNEDNSNINEFLSNLPDRISFEGRTIINPNGPHVGFIYYDHPFEAFLNLEVPMNLHAEDLTLVDTADFNLATGPEWDQIQGGEIRLLVENGMPFETVIDMTLLDMDWNVIETVIAQEIVAAPQLNSDLRVEAPLRSEIVIPLSKERIDLFQEAHSVRYQAKFNTTSQPNLVKIYSDYKIDLKLIGDFTYRLNN